MEPKTRRIVLHITIFLASIAGCTSSATPIVPSNTTPPHSTDSPTRTTEQTNDLELIHPRTRSRDGMELVYVPAGQFEMGSGQVDPANTVVLDAFWIDQTEVTNTMFVAFLNELGNQAQDGINWFEPGEGHNGIIYSHIEEEHGFFHSQPGYEDYPVIEVSWYGAAAYCSWAGGRLPSEAEWEYSARGPLGRLYPWGDTFDGERVNYCDASCPQDWRDKDFDDGYPQWGPVGSYPGGASWVGALDMVGNVWEWVNDWWSDDYYTYSQTDNPQGPDSGTLRITRGGSWFDESNRVNAIERKGLTPSSYRMHWVGFRCVVPDQPNDG